MGNIAGQRRGETYPKAAAAAAAAAGALIRAGFDNSLSTVVYSTGAGEQFVLKSIDGAPVEVVLTGFTPGNIILIFLSLHVNDDVASGPTSIQYFAFPTVNVGGADLRPDSENCASIPAQEPPPWSDIYFVKPDNVTADPVIRMKISNIGTDNARIENQGALLVACEINAANVTTQPTTVMIPAV